jgi:hypothetical protein
VPASTASQVAKGDGSVGRRAHAVTPEHRSKRRSVVEVRSQRMNPIAEQFARILDVVPPTLGVVASLVGVIICLAARRSMR